MYSSHPLTTVCPYHIFEIQQLHINDQQSKKKWKSHEQLNISQAVSVSKQVKQKYLIWIYITTHLRNILMYESIHFIIPQTICIITGYAEKQVY